MAERYDLIVIGAGNGGLMTACRAARMGLKALVIEQNNLPGGAATSFVRGRFEFEASLHEIPDFGEGDMRGELGRLFDELGINVEMLPIKNAFRYVVNSNGVNELDVTFPHGKEAIMDFVSDNYPEDVSSMEKLFTAFEELLKGMGYLGVSKGNPDPEELNENYPGFVKIMSMSAGEFLRSTGMSQEMIDILSAYWPYQGGDIDTIDASRFLLMLYGYLVKGPFVPKMRSHELSVAIMNRAVELGCEFIFDTEVTKILTKKGAVSGVEVDNGRIFEADAIASSAFPEIVYSKLIDDTALVPKHELKKTNARKYGFRSLCVYLGLDAPPSEIGITDYTIFLSTSKDTKMLYEAASTRNADENEIDICCLNNANPTCSPSGTTILTLTTAYTDDAWADVTEENYFKVKREVADSMIERVEKALSLNIRDHIEEIEIATPITFARYMRSPQGAIYGYASPRWDGMSSRTIAERTEPTVPGLFFIGGHNSSLAGYHPTYASGSRTAYRIVSYIMGGGHYG